MVPSPLSVVEPEIPKVRVSISTSEAERVPLRLESVVEEDWSTSAMEAEVTEARVGASSAPETLTVKD